MNEPLDPRLQQTVNRLRLAVLLPVLLAVVAVILFAAKLARQFRAGEEPAERTFAPPRPSVAGRSPSEVADGVVERPPQTTVSGHSNSAGALRALVAQRREPARPVVVTSSPTSDSATSSPPVRTSPAPVLPVLGVAELSPNGIVGRVFLRGTPPPEIAIPVDPACGLLPAGGPPLKTRFFVVDPEGGLADVFLWLYDFPGVGGQPPATPVEIHQRGCEYSPYVSAAFVGQLIRVFNDDPLMHNVHPTPVAAGNLESNRGQLPGGPTLNFSFAKPELFLRFKCDVHPWMFAYVNVCNHPFYAVSGSNGVFAMPEPPPGEYLLQILHRKTESRLVKVSVRQGRQLVVNATFDVNDPNLTSIKVTEQ